MLIAEVLSLVNQQSVVHHSSILQARVREAPPPFIWQPAMAALRCAVRCPACQNPVIENDAVCRHCGFTLEAADRHFGIAPATTKPVTDLAQALSSSEKRKLERASLRLLNRFPQLDVAVVLVAVPPEIPLSVCISFGSSTAANSPAPPRAVEPTTSCCSSSTPNATAPPRWRVTASNPSCPRHSSRYA